MGDFSAEELVGRCCVMGQLVKALFFVFEFIPFSKCKW